MTTMTTAEPYKGQAMMAMPEHLAGFAVLLDEVGSAVVWPHMSNTTLPRCYPVAMAAGRSLAVEFSHSEALLTVIDFDQPAVAHRHLAHTDGRGLTLNTADGAAWKTIRIPDDAPGSFLEDEDEDDESDEDEGDEG